jgi:hypothetical protein
MMLADSGEAMSRVQNKTSPYFPDESGRLEKAKRWIRQARGEELEPQTKVADPVPLFEIEAAPE